MSEHENMLMTMPSLVTATGAALKRTHDLGFDMLYSTERHAFDITACLQRLEPGLQLFWRGDHAANSQQQFMQQPEL